MIKVLCSKPPPSFSPSLDKLRLDKLLKSQELEDRLRPKRKPLPASLPPEDEAEVDALLRKRGIISRCVNQQVADNDLARLRPRQWLNDEIINFYGQMILSRSETSSGKENKENRDGVSKFLNVHYFNSFFWAKLSTTGYEKGRLSKWTKKVTCSQLLKLYDARFSDRFHVGRHLFKRRRAHSHQPRKHSLDCSSH